MNYVVFDLEWNQSPYGKENEAAGLPFEIIEIGAVKLNSEREVLDRFQVVIRPVVYRRLNVHTRRIVHLRQSELNEGEWFPDAVRRFLAWAGPDSVFCTWGTVDLPELQRNLKYYDLLHLLKGPLHYYDVQKLFAVQYEDMKSRRSLQYGAEYLALERGGEFHRALADADYTARIFQTIDTDVMLAYDSIDVYQNPRSKTEEIHLIYNGYSKYISREFADKEAAMRDAEVLVTPCCRCGRLMRKKIRWFAAGARNYYSVALCPEHGPQKGKIRVKHNDEGAVYVVKTIKISGEAEIESISAKRDGVREKRRRRRHS